MKDSTIKVQDFLAAANESSKRTRLLMIVIVVTGVLGFVGILNSYEWSWKRNRLQVVSNPESKYVIDKLKLEKAPGLSDERYKAFQQAVARDYVDSSFTIRVPFFGFSFDINDLAFLGGITYLVVLMLFRFSLRNEIITLRLAYTASLRFYADQPEELEAFYNLLAMRLVFTLPSVTAKDFDGKDWHPPTYWYLFYIPKLICFLPSFVYLIIVINDWMTKSVASEFNNNHVAVSLAVSCFFAVFIIVLSVLTFNRLRRIDTLWDKYWKFIQTKKGNNDDSYQDQIETA